MSRFISLLSSDSSQKYITKYDLDHVETMAYISHSPFLISAKTEVIYAQMVTVLPVADRDHKNLLDVGTA